MKELEPSSLKCTLEQSEQVAMKWYVAFTKPRQEETAQFYLSTKGIEVFYPKLFIPARSVLGQRAAPLFPSYIFVRINAASADHYQVSWCRGVKKLVCFGGAPSPVENHIVEFLREQADANGLIVARSNLRVGDQVQIGSGPFKGLVGIIKDPPDTQSRVKVLMGILSRQVETVVPASYINAGWVASCQVAQS